MDDYILDDSSQSYVLSCVLERVGITEGRAGTKAMSATLLTTVTEFLAALLWGREVYFGSVSKGAVHPVWQ